MVEILDTIAEGDPAQALHLCVGLLDHEPHSLLMYSYADLFQRINTYVPVLVASHPDLVLEALVLIDRAIQWSGPDMDYLTHVEARHTVILELIPQSAEKNLLTAIRACERLLLFSDTNSQIYSQTITLWRTYMSQLEHRHMATAASYYSALLASIKPHTHSLARECDAGFERCAKQKEFQSRTITPLTDNPA